MKKTFFLLVGILALAGFASMKHSQDSSDGSYAYASINSPEEHYKDEVVRLPVKLESELKKLAGLKEGEEVGYFVLFDMEDNAYVLGPSTMKDSNIYREGQLILNKGIISFAAVGAKLSYRKSHCVGLSFRYKEAGVIKEICY